MIDMHYDLLSVIYQCYLRMDYSYLENWLKNYHKDNVSKVIANLYFMNKTEMKEEYGDNFDDFNCVEMFQKASEILSNYMNRKDYVLSIEGADYINDETELEELYNLGLRNILLVWNNPNKYGSGIRGDYGLTELGKNFIIKAIDLGICIDVSHMNKKTFYDTIEVLKEQKKLGKKIKVIASHSNAYKICPSLRNLDDEQILALKEFEPVIGVVAYSEFVLSSRLPVEKLKEVYLEHVCHMVDLIGIDYVGIASDNMDFYKEFFGNDEYESFIKYENFKDEVSNLLKSKFSDEEVEKILYGNINKKLFEENEL